MKLYMAITRDRYELPYAVAGSLSELADLLHQSYNSVWYCWSRHKRGFTKWSQIIDVEIGEDPCA